MNAKAGKSEPQSAKTGPSFKQQQRTAANFSFRQSRGLDEVERPGAPSVMRKKMLRLSNDDEEIDPPKEDDDDVQEDEETMEPGMEYQTLQMKRHSEMVTDDIDELCLSYF